VAAEGRATSPHTTSVVSLTAFGTIAIGGLDGVLGAWIAEDVSGSGDAGDGAFRWVRAFDSIRLRETFGSSAHSPDVFVIADSAQFQRARHRIRSRMLGTALRADVDGIL